MQEIKQKKAAVKGMNRNSLDADLLDEQTRKNLGYIDENEIVIQREDLDKTHKKWKLAY